MNIRHKITLWITGAGLLAALLFSIIIVYELSEQPFEVVDRELSIQAYTLLAGLSPQNGGFVSRSDLSMLHSLGESYWFKVFDRQQNLVYASSMTQFFDLADRGKSERYNTSSVSSQGAIKTKTKTKTETETETETKNPDQEDTDEVIFRVRIFTIPFGGQEYRVQIARPMEKVREEINDLVIAITVGLVFFTLSLILLGYFVAGKILEPIATISTMASEISDKSLDKRIPLGATEDEIYTLSLSLNQMFDRLQLSFQHQKEFIANASHELKTPFAMLRLFFDEAMQREDLPLPFKRRLTGQVGILLRMNKLIKNLLDLSALEGTRTFNPETIDLTELATGVFGEFEEIIQAADIHLFLHMEDAVSLPADIEKIRRMLINLIDNAIKYNLKENGEIQFSLKKCDNMIQMEICNRGQTIPEGDLKKVFNQFYRVEKSRSTALGGSGLGLTIVKRIVELHHGTIEIKSSDDSRVRVKILLPSQCV